jgi:AcrR family transcriptional regulator
MPVAVAEGRWSYCRISTIGVGWEESPGVADTHHRADARRNYDRLLACAADAFAAQGTEASLRDVARRAGVGIGTLYRHFPTREALLEALLRDQFDKLRELAVELGDSQPPLAALSSWLLRLATASSAYRGLPESMMAALNDPASRLHAACAAMREAGARLLAGAQRAGAIRADLTNGEMLAIAAGVAWSAGHLPGEDPTGRLLTLITQGLAAQPTSTGM